MARQIQGLRNKRNSLIHELATAIGQRERELVKGERTPAAAKADFNFGDIKEAVRLATIERERRRAEAKAELRDWYDLLVQAINEGFVFEYRRRVKSE